MRKLGVSIIGCGSIFTNHCNAVMNSDLVKLISVVDINENKAKNMAEKYNCEYYVDYKEMLKDSRVDIIHICTPHYLHEPMAIDAMKNGKDVIVEKPLGINVAAAKNMIQVANETNRHLGVAFQNRYNPTSIKAKEIIESRELGEVKGVKGLVTWYRDRKYYEQDSWRGKWSTEGGGVLINQSIHTLDLMEWIVGDVEKIKGSIDTRVLNDVIEVEDTAEATLYYKNGAIGIFYATNCFTKDSPIEIEIHLEKGSLKITNSQLIKYSNGQEEVVAEDLNLATGEKSYWGKGHEILIYNFHKCIIEKNYTGYVTADEGIKALNLIEVLYKSSI